MASTIQIEIKVVDNFSKSIQSVNKAVKPLENSLKSINKQTDEYTKTNERLNQTLATVADTNRDIAKEIDVANSGYKAAAPLVGGLIISFATFSDKTLEVLNNFQGFTKVFGKALGLFRKFGLFAGEATKLTGSLAKAAFILNQGIIGLAVNTGTAGATLFVLGEGLKRVNNEVISISGQITSVLGVALLSFSAALSLIIVKLGQFAFFIGTKLVEAAQRATDVFVEYEKQILVFRRTIEGFSQVFGQSIGTVQSWEETVLALSESTGTTATALRAATTEIIATTSALGFSEDQMKKLLEIANDYAAQIGGDVTKATVDFVQALLGSTQGVIKYGVKLSEASLNLKLYKDGVNQTFRELTEAEKVQVRYNALLEQYAPIAGVAADLSKTLAGQDQVLEATVQRLNESFGRGAAIIEDNNIATFAANQVLSTLNTTVIQSLGFITALGGRILQVGGFFIEWSLKIAIVFKLLKVLNVFIASDLARTIVGLPIPLLNKSLIDLLKIIGITQTRVTSLVGAISLGSKIVVKSLKDMTIAALGLQGQAFTLSNVLRGLLIKSIKDTATALRILNKAVFRLLANPLVLTIVSLTAAIALLVKGLQEIERRTRALSTTWEVFNDTLQVTDTLIEPIRVVFQSFSTDIKNFVGKALGRLIATLNILVKTFIEFAALDPFGVFSQEQIVRLEQARKKLLEFDLQLQKAGDNIFALEEVGGKSTKGLRKDLEGLAKTAKGLSGAFKSLVDELSKAGKTTLQLLEIERQKRLQIIEEEIERGTLLRVDAARFIAQVEEDFARKTAKERERIAKENFDKVTGFFSRLVSTTVDIFRDVTDLFRVDQKFAFVAEVTDLPTQVKNSFENFRKAVDKLIEDLPTKLREFLEEFPAVLEGLVARLPRLFEVLLEFVPKFIRALGPIFEQLASIIAENAPRLIELILTSVTELVNLLPGIVARLAEGLGPLVASLFKNLPQLITSIFEVLPDIVKSLADAIPDIVEAFADNFAPIVLAFTEGLISSLGRIIAALVDSFITEGGLFRIVRVLIEAMPEVALAFVEGLGIGITTYVDSIRDSLVRAFKEASVAVGQQIGTEFVFTISKFTPKLFASTEPPRWLTTATIRRPKWVEDLARLRIPEPEWLKDLKEAANRIGGGGGGGGGTLGQIARRLPRFQEGGIVPSGFPGDTFTAANLSSGELVVSRERANRLFNIIDDLAEGRAADGAGEQNVVVNLTIGQEQLSTAILNLNRQGFRLA